MRLTDADARTRFAAARVLRLATTGPDRQPHVVPCTFVLDRDQVGIGIDHKPKESANLRRLRNIAANPLVSLIADHYSEEWAALWWVRADGEARMAAEPAERYRWWELLRVKYPQYAGVPLTGPVIVVAIITWRGWAYSGYPDPQRADGDK